ncbi:beta-galactosidase [Enterococcus sp. AZ194]|uniref:glycoside hydrolase family 2 TIM barrel-domain containing protein n=1 Tax=Enterococcus sp. AZ194 TaxID=2774629 RepID=UPI003F23D8E0
MKQLFLDNWRFIEKPLTAKFNLENAISSEEKFLAVEMPHDWLISDVNNLYRTSEGWYLKYFELKDIDTHDFYLEFDGIYMDAEIYLNGHQIARWTYGYTPLFLPIPQVNEGTNQLFVRVKHQFPNSRWYSGAGIYRNVWLHRENKVHIHPNEDYLHHEKIIGLDTDWALTIQHLLVNHTEIPKSGVLEICLKNMNNELYRKRINVNVQPGEDRWEKTISINKPYVWSPDAPHLYELITLFKTDETEQMIQHQIGFREIVVCSNEGLFLNGEHIKIQGVCQHHDLGALGAATNKAAIERQLGILKRMGVNAIRTAHNPFSKEFYQLADQMGFLVQSEFVDIWKHPKNVNDYSRFFSDWYARDIAAWIKRDRNHCCVFMWSIGNEIYDTHGREDGVETTKQLIQQVKKFDPMHNALISFGSNYLPWGSTQKAADLLDAVGYNYAENIYASHHEKYPDWIIYGSETASVAQSRDVYHFPLKLSTLADDDFQCSALGNSRTSWGAESIEACILFDRDTPYSLGQFVWSGFDYIGEPTPYNTKSSYLGQIDTAGFPKDAYYTFQAAWTDYKKVPMVHLFPYWDFTEGQVIDVRVCSNAPQIELFFNNQSLGKVENDPKHGERLLHDWEINYYPGELKAVAYDEKGKVIAVDKQCSFSEMTKIQLKPDKHQLLANGVDICFIEVTGIDEKGNEVKNANNDISVEVKGPGRLLGMDNGDSTDFSQYKTSQKRLFNGKLLLMIGGYDQSGTIEVICRSQGISESSIKLESQDALIEIGSNRCFDEIPYVGISPNISVRKIVLSSEVKKDGEIVVSAQYLPSNATTCDLVWRMTDERGIDTDIISWKIEGNRAIIKPIANGEIIVRCGVKNGKKHLDLYASLPLAFTGLKDSKINPYKPISGGRYSRSNVILTNGNERGVATLRDGESWVTFDEIDFGKKGTDNLTLSLFSLESDPFVIEIYKGYPSDWDSKVIDKVTYTKGSIWNTYQEQSYQLPEILTGVQTITFIFKQKVHLKEFTFKQMDPSFMKNYAIANDEIYGDSFIITKDEIREIGNNVTITFNEFDFGEKGAKGIEIFGNTLKKSNSIQLKISTSLSEERYLIDVKRSEESKIETYVFPKPIKGKCTIEFIFLPGSNFNFEWFKFISD